MQKQKNSKPRKYTVCWLYIYYRIIPTRSRQKFSKQICLWNLALIIGILFIIQIVEAI